MEIRQLGFHQNCASLPSLHRFREWAVGFLYSRFSWMTTADQSTKIATNICLPRYFSRTESIAERSHLTDSRSPDVAGSWASLWAWNWQWQICEHLTETFRKIVRFEIFTRNSVLRGTCSWTSVIHSHYSLNCWSSSSAENGVEVLIVDPLPETLVQHSSFSCWCSHGINKIRYEHIP